ncbi:MAG: accessory gene regulator B family protein [Lachnospiraceae bacterium]|nr:accessory gene regulator B family protein [Lachnospiraceae bacterium]
MSGRITGETMEKMANKIAAMLVRENIISDSMLEIYQYGLVRMFEIGTAVFTSFLLCLGLGMVKEGIIFFVFFMPLRSYLGGFHLKKYWQCYIMSCLTLLVVLVITRSVSLDIRVSAGIILLASVGIGWAAKREQKEAESRKYAWVVWGVLAILVAATVFCLVREQESVLVLLCCVTVIVLVSKVWERILHLPKRQTWPKWFFGGLR